MHVLLVDDEKLALDSLKDMMKQVPRVTAVFAFTETAPALEHLRTNGADVAFLDINMGDFSGLELAKQVKEICPACAIVFVTGYSQYAVDAFKLRASGYLLKPVRLDDIEAELDNIECHALSKSEGRRLQVQCFGDFEVFADGVPVKFERSKTKELFAYLIDRRGTRVTIGALLAVLWEDKPDSLSQRAQLRKLVADLMNALRAVHAEQVLIKERGSLAVAVDKLDCDYYSYLRHEAWAVNAFAGEYMGSYSWAEMTLGHLQG